MNDDMRTKLIQAAIYAPSADNSQPFRFKWSNDDTLQLFLDPELSGTATDSTFVLSDLAIGAIIESIVIEAKSLRFSVNISLFPDREKDSYFVAQLSFESNDAAIPETELKLAQQIPLRCTDRRFPFSGDVSDHMIEEIKAAVNGDNCQLLGFNQRDKIDAIIPTIFKAEKVRFESEQLHQELFKTVSFTRDKVESGMNLDVLGISKFESKGFEWMSNWKVMRFLNKLGASGQIAKKSVVSPIKQSPALLLLISSDVSREGIINAGRQLQRVWLKCTEMNLSVQLYAAPGVLSIAKPALSASLMDTINTVEHEMKLLTAELGSGVMFLRIGKYSGRPVRTGRRDIKSFIKN
ncbi:hypothetical protein [Neptunicella sp. SCSIO 80796]|uniref:hypothetical protein n=1 Tax=Neptunicella plasticusilytica TaxID=3117012 RepID=UPI003A4E30C1